VYISIPILFAYNICREMVISGPSQAHKSNTSERLDAPSDAWLCAMIMITRQVLGEKKNARRLPRMFRGYMNIGHELVIHACSFLAGRVSERRPLPAVYCDEQDECQMTRMKCRALLITRDMIRLATSSQMLQRAAARQCSASRIRSINDPHIPVHPKFDLPQSATRLHEWRTLLP
jgi:hypothetical protein